MKVLVPPPLLVVPCCPMAVASTGNEVHPGAEVAAARAGVVGVVVGSESPVGARVSGVMADDPIVDVDVYLASAGLRGVPTGAADGEDVGRGPVVG
jgi:hypothetical protein